MREAQEVEVERGVEERGRAVLEFEKVMMGLEGGGGKAGGVGKGEGMLGEEGRMENKGVKRKFELDEDEMLKNAKEERAKARKAIDDEKVSPYSAPSYHRRTDSR